VNATPWAEVWIDGRSLGETPLANVEVPVGEHELVFRHPDLGERRQRVVVRADAVALASATFR
jgi:serine/threonine-protein kinase